MSGIYIHIPFCSSKCYYCDFFSGPCRSADVKQQFSKALIKEYETRKTALEGRVNTIYIGGGTPSQMPVTAYDELFTHLPDDTVEFTMEVNPEDVDRDFAQWLSKSPVNRVSMGVQSFISSELEAIGRRHTPGKAAEAVEMLRDAGIRNISLDLMFGLPEQTLGSFAESLERTLSLTPEHISAYALMLEPGTRLTAMINAGKISEPDSDEAERMYRHLCDTMRENGYEHYEISNFALPGYRSRHNSSYWNFTPYLGLGPSAHSYLGGRRYFNAPAVKKYIENPCNPVADESLNLSKSIDEYIMVRLRTAEGISLDDFEKRFGARSLGNLMKRAGRISSNLIQETGHLRIPEELWIVSDPIIIELFED